MPQALIFIAPATFGAAGSLALVTAAGTLTGLGIATSVAGSLLLSVASAALSRPVSPKPENVQLTIRQAVGPRIRHYGLVRAGGTMVFFRTRGGFFYRVVVHGHGEIDGIEAHILNKEEVSLDLGGWVTDAQYVVNGRARVRILSRPGAVPGLPYAQIGAVWPEWDDTHRLDGLWTSLTIAEQVGSEDYRATYPNNEPALEIVARTARVRDPRSGITAYSTNAAAIIGDFIEHADGFNRPGRLHLPSFQQAAADCDDPIPLSAGGTEPRYRICGSFSLAERPQDVLRGLLDACAGAVSLRPDGTIGLRVGKRRAPTVVLTIADVIGMQDFSSGPDQLDRYNELPFTYVDPALGFVQTTGESWSDAAREAIDGETMVGPQLDLSFVPSHGQGRRIAKQRLAADNPAMTLSLHCHPRAIRALYEETVILDLPEIGITGTFRIMRYDLALETGAVTYEFASADLDSADWLPEEEGQPQTLPPGNETDGVPAPTGFAAAGFGAQVSQSSFAAGIMAVWDAPPSDALEPVLSCRVAPDTPGGLLGAGALAWFRVPLDPSARSAQISGLSDGVAYDLRLAWRTSAGDLGPYATDSGVVAAAATEAPAAPTGLSVTDAGGGDATLRFRASTSASVWKSRVLRDGVAVADVYSNPGQDHVLTDSVGPGSYSWAVRSINISDVPSATDAGPVSQTIT